jgi:hypothetical protein
MVQFSYNVDHVVLIILINLIDTSIYKESTKEYLNNLRILRELVLIYTFLVLR